MVQDDYQVDLMYDAALGDMVLLEKQMLKTISYFINKLEPMQDIDFRNVV